VKNCRIFYQDKKRGCSEKAGFRMMRLLAKKNLPAKLYTPRGPYCGYRTPATPPRPVYLGDIYSDEKVIREK
jgi:hypothetical protein